MSRRSGPSDVRGPTSALTSFLKSKNIHVPNANRFRRRDADEAPVLEHSRSTEPATPGAVSDEPSTSASPVPQSPRSAAQPRPRPPRRSAVSASMQFEEDDATDEELPAPPSRSSKHILSSNEGAAAGPSAKRGKIEPETLPGSAQASGSNSAGRNVSYRHTRPGEIDFCPLCTKRFTITSYTRQTPDGGLCHKCGPMYKGPGAPGSARAPLASINGNSAADSSLPKKKVVRRKLNRPLHDFSALPTLQALCIDILSTHIENVEALMGIGGKNMDAISKSISKNRRLNSQTVQLFLQADAKQLAFYDCSQLHSDALASIATFSPGVEQLNLQLCGMLDNVAMDAWTAKLTKLRSLELYGCFLVRIEAWHRFFATIQDRLTSFKIRESPRFDKSCCEKLVEHCPNVTELGLAQIGPLDADCLKVIESYGQQLTYLDISDPGVSAPGIPPKSLEDGEVISLLMKTGSQLRYLNLSRNADLTSRTLLEGVLENCKSLNTLLLCLCGTEGVEAAHFMQLFQGLKQRGCSPLTHISLERCLVVNDEVIEALIDFSGNTLVDISINSCDQISAEGFTTIARRCPSLKKLDAGFCRNLTDACVMDMINNIKTLEEVWLFSCNKISNYLSSDRVRIIGKEKYVPA